MQERWDANVSTLYNDGQLCIYCLFIVDLYIKRNEYIIYLYITKYYDLVSEVGIEKQYFSGVSLKVGPFRMLLKAPFAVEYVLSSILLAGFFFVSTVMTRFCFRYLSHWYHNTVTVGVQSLCLALHINAHIQMHPPPPCT